MLRYPADIIDRLKARYHERPVCVTGGAGFIGGHLVDALVSLGAQVSVIDDLSNSTPEHVAELVELEPDRVRFVHGSILDDAALADAMHGSALVFHLAAMGSVPRSIEDPERAWAVNATGTMRVLQAARAAGASRVVFAASSSAYGRSAQMPKVESMLPSPLSPYAASKLAGEALMSCWAGAYGVSTVSLRYFNVFGPRQKSDSDYAAVVAGFASRLLAGLPPLIYGDGSFSRDFTFVGNAVAATLLAGACEHKLAGEVFNVGAGRRTTILELARVMAKVCDQPQLQPEFKAPRTGDVPHSLADLTRAASVLGYHPIVDLEDGLEQTVAWYRSGLGAGSKPRGRRA